MIVTDTWYKPFGLSVRQPWFLDRAHGGGMWFMNGNHMIDRLIWFTGSRVVAVKAWIGNPLLGLKSDDSSVAVLEHANGLLSTLTHAGYDVNTLAGRQYNERFDGMLGVSSVPALLNREAGGHKKSAEITQDELIDRRLVKNV